MSINHSNNSLWGDVCRVLEKSIGVPCSEDKVENYRSSFRMAATQLELSSEDVLARKLLANTLTKDESDVLHKCVTVRETYFFREDKSIYYFIEEILPERLLLAKETGEPVQIWCAGCCTGEEPYSIAILLLESYPHEMHRGLVSILGTDLCREYLKIARRGTYSTWSFRSTSKSLKEKYFREIDAGRFEVRDDVRELVTFNQLNLVSDVFPPSGHFDVIFCRNVLMYFADEKVKQVLQKFNSCLKNNGYLIPAICEVFTEATPGFKKELLGGVGLYQRVYEAGCNQSERDNGSEVPRSIPQEARPIIRDTEVRSTTQPHVMIEGKEPPIVKDSLPKYCANAELTERSLDDRAPETMGSVESIEKVTRDFASRGLLTKAKESCEHWIERDPGNPSAYYVKALLLLEFDKPEEAIDALKRAIFLKDDFVLAHFTIGQIAFNRRDVATGNLYYKNTRRLLQEMAETETLLESDGMSAGQFLKSIEINGDKGL